MLRRSLAAIFGLSLIALPACTSTESVLDVSGTNGPVPPASVGADMPADAPVAFASGPGSGQAELASLSSNPPSAEASPAQPAPAAPPAPAATAPAMPAPVNTATSPAQPPPPAIAALSPQQATTVQVAPIIGATAQSVAPLSQRMALRASERGITLTNQSGGSHVLKGYFSAMPEGERVTVIYVWDVLDAAGNRVHRIQGQQATAGAGKGWQAVDVKTMEAIADRTVDELAAWLASRFG